MGRGTLTDYYKEASNNKLIMNGTVSDWCTTSKSHNYYGANVSNGLDSSSRLAELIKEAVMAADVQGMDFSQFDNDHDGYVDNVIVIFQGQGEDEGSDPNNIWPCWYRLSYTGDEINVDGKTINSYTIQSERISSGICTIGVFAHELGHSLGLPDLYDTGNNSFCIGNWCLMAFGSWGTTNKSGDTPVHPCAWCKNQLGWLTPTKIPADTSLNIAPVE